MLSTTPTAGLDAQLRLGIAGGRSWRRTIRWESAPDDGAERSGGYPIRPDRLIALRFEIEHTIRLREIGGSFANSSDTAQEVVVSLVSLRDLDDVPCSSDLTRLDALCSARIRVPPLDGQSHDRSAPVDAMLHPGAYALLVGVEESEVASEPEVTLGVFADSGKADDCLVGLRSRQLGFEPGWYSPREVFGASKCIRLFLAGEPVVAVTNRLPAILATA